MSKPPRTVNVGKRALVFGGAYGNLQATRAVFDYAQAHGFKPEQVIFTGDMVAYCGNPQETSDLIRNSGCHVVMGNCEESLGLGRDDCGCGFEDNTQCSILSAQWFSFCQEALNERTKEWMGTLPKEIIVKTGSFSLLCTHGTPETINEFVFPSDIANYRYKVPGAIGIDGYLVGHSGIPFLAEDDGRLWINSGAAGMPANDGSTVIWFVTLEADGDKLEAQTHSLEYEHEDAAEAMMNAGLNNGYRGCLTNGIWPSHDVLPDHERSQTGSAVRPQKKALRKALLSAAV